MLRRRPSLMEYPASNGFLPLANAIIQGEMCIIDLLLSAGCSVHIGDPGSGRTPLHVGDRTSLNCQLLTSFKPHSWLFTTVTCRPLAFC